MITIPTDNTAPILHEDASFQSSPGAPPVSDIDAAAPMIHEDPAPSAAPPRGGEIPEPSDDGASAEVFTWCGVKLHPFNTSRAALFAQHRLAVGAPSLYLVIDDVDGFLADAVRILWLCTHTAKDWSAIRCNPSALQNQIDQWADAQSDFDSVVAVLTALKIYGESRQ